MADFEKAIQKILRHEGVTFGQDGFPVPGKTGYVHHHDDPGGETNYGITRKVATENGYNGLMSEIPFTKVKEIYRKKYWDKFLGDLIPDQEIAEEIFDTAVNCGVETVVLMLQRTLNVLNKQGTLYTDIKVDGQCGQQTIAVLKQALLVNPKYQKAILVAVNCLQGVRYVELSEKNVKFESFLPGWLLNRVGIT